jgi:prolyl-tRNA synthetase
LRTTEFLWQEGHTAHATEAEAREETLKILDLYADFAENQLAIPVIKGEKTAVERFPGAVATYSIEAMMQDGKALQSGTTHFLGQNFSRAAEIKFLNTENQEDFAWTTSWGVSTRLIGGVIMTHSDDDGLMLPPRVAPAQLVILPVVHQEDTRGEVLEYCERLMQELRERTYAGRPLAVTLDTRDLRGGEKMWSWIKKGAPVRLEVGPRDMAADSVFVGRRDRSSKERYGQPRAEFIGGVVALLDEIQDGMLQRARDFQKQHTRSIDNKEEFYEFFTPQKGAEELLHGGFALTHWSGEAEVEERIKNDLNVTIRNIPLLGQGEKEEGVCPFSGKVSPQRVVFAKAY